MDNNLQAEASTEKINMKKKLLFKPVVGILVLLVLGLGITILFLLIPHNVTDFPVYVEINNEVTVFPTTTLENLENDSRFTRDDVLGIPNVRSTTFPYTVNITFNTADITIHQSAFNESDESMISTPIGIESGMTKKQVINLLKNYNYYAFVSDENLGGAFSYIKKNDFLKKPDYPNLAKINVVGSRGTRNKDIVCYTFIFEEEYLTLVEIPY